MNGTEREQVTKEILVNLMEMESPRPRPILDIEQTTKQLVVGLVDLHERIAELDKTAEVDERIQLKEALDKTRQALEIRIAQRTEALRHLQQANERLQAETNRRKRTEEVLHICETRYRAFLEGSIQGIALIDQDGRHLLANQALLDMFGYDSLDVYLRHNIQDNLARHERVRIRANWQALLRGDPVPARYHYQGLRMDGTPAWIESLVTPITWEGKPALMIASQDLTKRKQAEAAYAKIKNKLKQIQAAETPILTPTSHANPAPSSAPNKFRLLGKRILAFLRLSRPETSIRGAPEI
ncbi:MAG: PAS domain S-box protein [bacterium]|nr:PAS domain S-box protein [bacterium]